MRIKGDLPFSGNFEAQKAAPFADFFCETITDLIDINQQKAHDGIAYLYPFKKAIVYNDADVNKNGTYELVDIANPQLEVSWKKIGSSEGTNPYSPIQLTYLEAKTLVDSNSLLPGVYYQITDYTTVMDAGEGIYIGSTDYTGTVYIGAVEAMTIQANSINSFDTRAYSDSFKDDDIIYDFTKNILTVVKFGYIEDSVNSGTIQLTVTGANIMDTDIELIVNENIYIEFEDSVTGYHSYDFSNLGTDFTVTSNGGGGSRITLSDVTVDFNAGSYWFYLDSSVKIANMKGEIIYRKNRTKNISANCNFRDAKYLRFRPDLTDTITYPVFDPSALYSYRDFVQYNGDIYFYMPNHSVIGQIPSNNSQYWAIAVKEADNAYKFASDYVAQKTWSLDLIYKLMPIIGEYDYSTQTAIANELRGFKDVEIKTNGIVLLSTQTSEENIRNVKIGTNCINTTILASNLNNFNLTDDSNGNAFGKDFYIYNSTNAMKFAGCCSDGQIIDSSVGELYNTVWVSINRSNINSLYDSLIGNMEGSNIATSVSNLRIGVASKLNIGNNSYNLYLKYSTNSSFGLNSHEIYSYTNIFDSMRFGNETRHLKFEAGHSQQRCIFGDQMGPVFGERIINTSMLDCTAGSMFLTYDNINITNGIQFCHFGDNCRGLIGTFWYNSEFGSNCHSITVAQNMNGSRLGSTCFNLNLQYLQLSQLENQVANVTARNVSASNFGSQVGNLTFANDIVHCDFGNGVDSITSNYASAISNLVVAHGLTTLIIPAGSVWAGLNTQKEVYKRPDGTLRVKYMSDTDSIVITDPTT